MKTIVSRRSLSKLVHKVVTLMDVYEHKNELSALETKLSATSVDLTLFHTGKISDSSIVRFDNLTSHHSFSATIKVDRTSEFGTAKINFVELLNLVVYLPKEVEFVEVSVINEKLSLKPLTNYRK